MLPNFAWFLYFVPNIFPRIVERAFSLKRFSKLTLLTYLEFQRDNFSKKGLYQIKTWHGNRVKNVLMIALPFTDILVLIYFGWEMFVCNYKRNGMVCCVSLEYWDSKCFRIFTKMLKSSIWTIDSINDNIDSNLNKTSLQILLRFYPEKGQFIDYKRLERIQGSHKHLKWRVLKQYLTTLHLRCLWESWIRSWNGAGIAKLRA